MSHDLDHDACCIHCGLDACDVARDDVMPPCEVWNPELRARNFAAWLEVAEAQWDEA